MPDISSKNREVLVQRLQQLADGVKRLQTERKSLTSAKRKIKAAERTAIDSKITAELLQRENEILKIESVLRSGGTKRPPALKAAKLLIEKKGLKKQAKAYIASRTTKANQAGTCSDCITNCSQCVTAACLTCIASCATTCATGCTTCTTCISEELVGHVPSVTVIVP